MDLSLPDHHSAQLICVWMPHVKTQADSSHKLSWLRDMHYPINIPLVPIAIAFFRLSANKKVNFCLIQNDTPSFAVVCSTIFLTGLLNGWMCKEMENFVFQHERIPMHCEELFLAHFTVLLHIAANFLKLATRSASTMFDDACCGIWEGPATCQGQEGFTEILFYK